MKLEDAHQGEKVEGKKTTVNFMPNSTDVCSYNKHSGFLHNASARWTSRPVHSKTNSTGQYNWTISMNHWKLKSKRVSGQALPSGEQTRQQNYPRRNIVKQCYVWTLLQTKRNNNNAQKHLSHLIGWWDEDFCSSSGMAPMGKVSKVIVMHSHGRQTNQRVHIIKVMKTMVSDSKIKTNFYAYSNCSSKTRDVAM